MGCPFCDYSGPSEVLYETDGVFAIEPLNPVTPGHRLFVPRRHVPDAAADPALAGWVFRLAAIYAAGKQANIITSIGPAATQTIGHLHVHVIPRVVGDGLALPWSSQGGT